MSVNSVRFTPPPADHGNATIGPGQPCTVNITVVVAPATATLASMSYVLDNGNSTNVPQWGEAGSTGATRTYTGQIQVTNSIAPNSPDHEYALQVTGVDSTSASNSGTLHFYSRPPATSP